MSKLPSNAELAEQVAALADTVDALKSAAQSAMFNSGPSTYEIDHSVERAVEAKLAPIIERLDILTGNTSQANASIKRLQSAPQPNTAKTISAALEPIMDEIIRVEEGLKQIVASKTSGAATAAADARNAAEAYVKSAELSLLSAARRFAFGDDS